MRPKHWLPGREADTATIDEIRFRHFKAFPDFVVPLGRTTILVGPNNSGKSTIVGALRTLSAGLQTARARKPEPFQSLQPAYRVPEEGIPISLENARTDFDDAGEPKVTFTLSNSNRLSLIFPSDGGCLLIPEIDGPPVSDTVDFKRAFPVAVAHVPVLGPVEHDEPLVQRATVTRSLSTHRASRQFRSYWWYERDRFDAFRRMLRKTWPGVDIRPPEVVVGGDEPKVVMWCVEGTYPREIYWAGSGFQIWCQLLTHIERASEASLLVIDEPEIYLHSDLQRQLLGIVRGIGADVVVATHSTELIAEAEPTDLLLIDKRKTRAKRVADAAGVGAALDAVGSVHNVAFTQIARTRRALLLEGGDFSLLGKLARRLRLDDLAGRRDFAIVLTNGFPAPKSIRAFKAGIEAAVGSQIMLAGIFDRDYRSDDEVNAVVGELTATVKHTYVLERKEIENYVLVPSALQRAVDAAVAARRERGDDIERPSVIELLNEVTDTIATEVRDHVTATRIEHPGVLGLAMVTKTARANRYFDSTWSTLDGRLSICPGKKVLSLLNQQLQAQARVSISPSAVALNMRPSEVPEELRRILKAVDSFRRA